MAAAKRAAEFALIREEDANRTMSNWRSLGLPALRLKCNLYHLSEGGKKDEIILRLVNELENLQRNEENTQTDNIGNNTPNPEEPPANPSEENAGDDILDLQNNYDISELDDEYNEYINGEQDGGTVEEDETGEDTAVIQNGGDSERTRTENSRERDRSPAAIINGDQNNIAVTDTTVKTTLASTNNGGARKTRQPGTSEQTGQTTNEQFALILQEMRNVRSEVTSLKSKHDSLEKRVSKSLTKNPSSSTASRKRPPTNTSTNRDRQPPQKVSKPDHQQRSVRITTDTPAQTAYTRSPPPTSPTISVNQHATPPDSQLQHPAQNDLLLQQAIAQSLNDPGISAQPPTQGDSLATTGMSVQSPSFTSPANDPWDSWINPFMPPSIKDTQLKKIEEGQFVDFIDLLPENQIASIEGSQDNGPGIDVEKPSGYLKQKDNKARKVRVNTFQRWSTAWCIFSQAHLHYHPRDYYELFTYHATFVEFISEYKFEACFNYDRDFRLSIANQRNVDPKRRKAFWSVPSEKIRNRYLNNHNSLTKCEYCKGPGHYISNCSQKQKDESKTLPAQLAAALSMTKTQLVQHEQQASQQTSSQASQQTWTNNNNSFRAPKNNQSSGGRIPASKKPCWRFQIKPCHKPPCQFLHACENCGDTKHGSSTCYQTTSTNFIPLMGPQR